MITPNNQDYRTIEVDTGNKCQLKCPTCNRQDKNFKHLIKDNNWLGLLSFKLMVEKFPNVNRFFLGLMFDEPTFNPNLLEIVKYLKEQNKAITLNTNGCNIKFGIDKWKELIQLLDSNDRIVWSLDGLSEETYIQHRKGGNFKVITNTITQVTNIKLSKVTNIIQIIKFEHNQKEIEQNLDNFKRIHNILWKKPVWDIIESNGQCTIPASKVKPTWDINKQNQLKNEVPYSETIWKRCTNLKIGFTTLFVSHTGTIGFCLPNLISNLKSEHQTINITNSTETINSFIKEFYKSDTILKNETCQFYCGKKSVLAKKEANLNYDIT